MKRNFKKIIALLVIPCLFVFTACDENEFLTELDPNTPTIETFWKTKNQFDVALTTVYGALQFSGISGENSIFEMAKADISGTDSWQNPFSFVNLTYGEGSDRIENIWNALYIGIFRANQLIENIQTADSAIFKEGEREIIEGQARFLRAWFYFKVAHSFGGAVKRLKAPKSLEDVSAPFVSIEEITNDVIIPDFNYAITNLPQTWSSADKGRATWGAATTMLGRVYLFNKDFVQASSLFKDVIDSNVYSLTKNFQDNFKHDTELNSESIFEVAFNSDIAPGVLGQNVDDTPDNDPGNSPGAETTNIATQFGFLDNGGFNTLMGSYHLHELFINEEIDPTNPINTGNNHSTRLTATLAVPQGEGTWYTKPTSVKATGRSGQSAYIRKWTNAYHLENEPANNRSGINFRHMRLSNVYLMYAEAVLEATGNVAEAQKYIDLVRSRAGVKTITQYAADNGGMIPQLHISKIFNITGQPLVPLNADNLLTHIMRVERPLELCFEGHRWKDLVRWGIVKEVFTQLVEEEMYRNTNFATFENQAPLFLSSALGQSTPRRDFELTLSNYDASIHDYWSVPPSEQRTNNGL